MIVYIDTEHRVHTSSTDDCTTLETNIFDGLPYNVIECYKYFPADETHDEFAQAWKSADEINRLQMLSDCEKLTAQNAEYEAALSEIEAALGVSG